MTCIRRRSARCSSRGETGRTSRRPPRCGKPSRAAAATTTSSSRGNRRTSCSTVRSRNTSTSGAAATRHAARGHARRRSAVQARARAARSADAQPRPAPVPDVGQRRGRSLLERAGHPPAGVARRRPAHRAGSSSIRPTATSRTRTGRRRRSGAPRSSTSRSSVRVRLDWQRRCTRRPKGLRALVIERGSDRGPGRVELDDPELPRLLARRRRQRSHAARVPAGVDLRDPVPPAAGGDMRPVR